MSVPKNTFCHRKVIQLSFLIALCSLLIAGTDNSGGPLTIEADVVYSVTNETEAKTYTDFSYNGLWYATKPLSDDLTGSPSVTIKDNKLTITLDVPKTASLIPFSHFDFSMSPADAKGFSLGIFVTSDSKYALTCVKDSDNWARLVYADKDAASADSSSSHTHIRTFNYCSFQKGWNYQIFSRSGPVAYTITITSSTTLPDGFKWTVRENHY